MPTSVNVNQAKTHFSKLLARVEADEEIIISKAGRPIAKIVPFQSKREPRHPGTGKGKLWIADDFDADLPEEIIESFYEERQSAKDSTSRTI